MTPRDFIGHYLAENRMSLRKYSRETGIPVMTLSNMLRDGSRPNYKTCSLLAKYHNLNLDDVLRMAGHLPGTTQNIEMKATLANLAKQLAKLQETIEKLAAQQI